MTDHVQQATCLALTNLGYAIEALENPGAVRLGDSPDMRLRIATVAVRLVEALKSCECAFPLASAGLRALNAVQVDSDALDGVTGSIAAPGQAGAP